MRTTRVRIDEGQHWDLGYGYTKQYAHTQLDHGQIVSHLLRCLICG
jgi:hypothetical protein